MELNKEQNLALCHDFISFFTEQGMVAVNGDLKVHKFGAQLLTL